MKPRVLMVVSASLGASDEPAPRPDFKVLAERLDASLLDRSQLQRSFGTRAAARLIGPSLVQTWLAFRLRHRYDLIYTDGEHLGIPLALLLKVARDPIPHVTIGHRISAWKKRPFLRWLRLHTHITRIVLHSRRQYEIAVDELRLPPERLALVPYQVDADFWWPRDQPDEPLVCAAGLECRDYATLLRAVEGLGCRVVIAAASRWSRHRFDSVWRRRPRNVEVTSLGYARLRDLYARASVVVVPLHDADYQAGVTTILEAMAMAKALVVSHSAGQTDVVQDRRTTVRGERPRPRSPSFLAAIARVAAVDLEPNGLYVPPGDADALRSAIRYLLDHAEVRARFGLAGRRLVERLLTVEHFASRVSALIREASSVPSSQPRLRLASPSR